MEKTTNKKLVQDNYNVISRISRRFGPAGKAGAENRIRPSLTRWNHGEYKKTNGKNDASHRA